MRKGMLILLMLALIAMSVTAQSVTIAWDRSPDPQVLKYLVERDGVLQGETPDTRFELPVVIGKEHRIRVRSYGYYDDVREDGTVVKSLGAGLPSPELLYTFMGQVPSNLLTNGSFEDNLAGWTANGSVRILSNSTSTQGTKLADFNYGQQTPNGTLTQTVVTLPGATYTVTYDVGAMGIYADPMTIELAVLKQTKRVSVNGANPTRWALNNTHVFVAESATTTLTFRDVSATTNSVDARLDNVRLTLTSPPPPPPPDPVPTPVCVWNGVTYQAGQRVEVVWKAEMLSGGLPLPSGWRQNTANVVMVVECQPTP